MSKENTAANKSWVDKMIGGIEAVCNKLPPPAILFCVLFVFVAVIGAIFSIAGVSLVNPSTGEAVVAANLFSTEGLHWFLTSMVKNFTGFAPLGLVITMTLAIGLCEESGMLIALLNTALKNVPATLVPYVIAFVGTVGNIASDTAMVVIPPLAALVYMGVGKHPVIGMMVGYAGAQAGFTANLMIAGTDTLLQGLTNDAILSFLPDTTFAVDAACNWYFMIASTFLCSLVIGTVSIKLIEPRFGKYEGSADSKIDEVTADQKKGLRAAGITAVVYIALVAALYYGGPLKGMFLKGMIPILFCLFSLCGLAFGYTSKAYKNVVDVNKAMTRQMSAMGSYILFCFFCGQFQGLFNWTKLGTMLAIAGADFFESIGFTGIPLCVAFIVLCAFVNIFISSGSAKWAIFAPIFVPMFMLLGYTPAFTQYIYRLGDSAGNMFGPTGATLWMLLSMAQEKYDKNLTIGKFLSCNMTTALILEAFWIVFLVIWMLAGIPVGPGEGIWLATPIA